MIYLLFTLLIRKEGTCVSIRVENLEVVREFQNYIFAYSSSKWRFTLKIILISLNPFPPMIRKLICRCTFQNVFYVKSAILFVNIEMSFSLNLVEIKLPIVERLAFLLKLYFPNIIAKEYLFEGHLFH